MFSPTPAISVETGKNVSSRAPFRYSGRSGPRTFEISMFAGSRPSASGRAMVSVSDSAKAITA